MSIHMIMYVFMTLLYIAQIVSSNKQEFLQLDGAFKASALGGTVIGCQSKNASILVTYSSNCIENRSNNPIKMSYAFGIAITGLAADATYITNKIFDDYSEYKFIYDAHIPIQRLAANIAQMKHKRTLSLAQRPYGIRTVIIGYDDHLLHQLYEIDPIGSLHKCKLCLVGPYCKELNSEWGNTQDPSNLSTEEAISHCIATLRKVLLSKSLTFTPSLLSIATVKKDAPFKLLSVTEVAQLLGNESM